LRDARVRKEATAGTRIYGKLVFGNGEGPDFHGNELEYRNQKKRNHPQKKSCEEGGRRSCWGGR